MNLRDILTISLYYVYRKCVGATNENLNFNLRVYRKPSYLCVSQGREYRIIYVLKNKSNKTLQLQFCCSPCEFSNIVIIMEFPAAYLTSLKSAGLTLFRQAVRRSLCSLSGLTFGSSVLACEQTFISE